ncbi:sugar-transfer associated ATP-grasp domain-containing protein [Anaerococcus rubeinfantis]|uniref:sugar-transfer associated ATP-grasp domain-containing protein n=1 Tax=Anaerococcus rubeinfantis TaxID=1720199 RepID=UPI00073F0122|nr:sugar-transfer associated ATP-grasp domain-containing protein [Anaerococcus rubeinfantis]
MDNNEKIRLTGYNNEKGVKAYVKNHINKYSLLKNMFIGETSKLESVKIFFDFWISVIVLGAGINDYFQYNFYKKNYSERNKFIVGRKWKKILIKCNGSTKIDLFDDKLKFNNKFNDFLKRDWLDVDNTRFEDFSDFILKHDIFFLKQNIGSGGNGITKHKSNEIKNFEEFYKKINGKSFILEGALVQNKELAEFNPSSVNTIRVVTIRDNEKVHVMDAILRMGNGEKSTDNFHQHGLAMKMDVKTGEVISCAIDKSNNKYYEHPISHKKLLGFKVPYWNEVIDTVIRASKVSNEVRYVGWDIAILDNGEVSIIEGNCSADPDITQMPEQIGRWEEYKKVIDNL